jgi:hypothetical protein
MSAQSQGEHLRNEGADLIAACEAANADTTLNALVDEWQAIADPIEEPSDGCTHDADGRG